MRIKAALVAIASKRFLVGAGAVVAACAAGPLSAQVTNESFEDPVSAPFETKPPRSIANWSIGGTDEHIDGDWQARDENQSVDDLNGISQGSLLQDLSLTLPPLEPYDLSFWVALNWFNHDFPFVTFAGGNLFQSITEGSFGPASITSIPEPETYAMLLAGLGLIGFIVRRRRRSLHNAA